MNQQPMENKMSGVIPEELIGSEEEGFIVHQNETQASPGKMEGDVIIQDKDGNLKFDSRSVMDSMLLRVEDRIKQHTHGKSPMDAKLTKSAEELKQHIHDKLSQKKVRFLDEEH